MEGHIISALLSAISLSFESKPNLAEFLMTELKKHTTILNVHDFPCFDQQLCILLLKNGFTFDFRVMLYAMNINIHPFSNFSHLDEELVTILMQKNLLMRNDPFIPDIYDSKHMETYAYEQAIDHDDIEWFTQREEVDFNCVIYRRSGTFNYISVPAISYCIEKQAMKCFKFFLLNGANLLFTTEECENGATELELGAAFRGFAQIYQRNNPELHETYTPLAFAYAVGNIEMIKILSEYGYKANNDESAIIAMLKFHQYVLFKHFFKVLADDDTINKYAHLILFNCCRYNNINSLKFFLQNWHNPIHIDLSRFLVLTTIHDSVEIAQVLLEYGADPNYEIEFNHKPSILHTAIKANARLVAYMLLEYGAIVDNGSRYAVDIIYELTYSNNLKLLEEILKRSTPQFINIKRIPAKPVLWGIAGSFKYDACKLLLKYGADVNITHDDKTILDRFGSEMIEKGHYKLFSLLVKAGAKYSQ